MSEPWARRVKCGCCGDWACGLHQGHIGENCGCWPCDDCRDLSDELDDAGLCPECRSKDDLFAAIHAHLLARLLDRLVA